MHRAAMPPVDARMWLRRSALIVFGQRGFNLRFSFGGVEERAQCRLALADRSISPGWWFGRPSGDCACAPVLSGSLVLRCGSRRLPGRAPCPGFVGGYAECGFYPRDDVRVEPGSWLAGLRWWRFSRRVVGCEEELWAPPREGTRVKPALGLGPWALGLGPWVPAASRRGRGACTSLSGYSLSLRNCQIVDPVLLSRDIRFVTPRVRI